MAYFLLSRQRIILVLLTVCFFFLWKSQVALQYSSFPSRTKGPLDSQQILNPHSPSKSDGQSPWARIPQRYPVRSMIPMPSPVPNAIPTIQHRFERESSEARAVRIARLNAVKGNFTHAWSGYKAHAWLRDEVKPLSGQAHDPFGGWAATLVDALDTLWIMGLKDEFERAVEAVAKLDFGSCTMDEVSVFETNIRYLGGLLSAYDLTGGKYAPLLQKAVELGQMLYVAFDTPNRMPITRWNFAAALNGGQQKTQETVLVADLGSLTLEFTRLSQITKDPRYFDAVQRIMDVFGEQQPRTKIPGLWPVVVNVKKLDFTSYAGFTLGGMADSLYEYLLKEHILLGGGTQRYQELYQHAMEAIKRHMLYRPMTDGGEDILFSGSIWADSKTPLSQLDIDAEAQHLACFLGGMVAIGAKIFNKDEELEIARKLVHGCIWAYETNRQGIMPEVMHTVPCDDQTNCPWNSTKWFEAVDRASPQDSRAAVLKIKEKNLPPGISGIDDTRYILRPEAIESIFILYRITGNPSLPDKAWRMFNAIIKSTITDIGHAALEDCTIPNPPKADRMESFWLAETLKYFYLMFSEPDVISLDEYVLNTEGHPLKRSV
ncbi:conserved hypothetical protein [Uncinocarpus reesii 1704]|uniref:alpha-1,2-Mannosidase n=1 Tax=Uncinocarpus reesii (strain UAMH 1704) TaxID=336963 RepID=C4JV20_UNCRE|nr:uncharacterized protein UREG_04973 [Uncinocarpus reesii 1704]EEP80131.1 conserved hypothetical protein [Uncinocarpus reesii 1704]